MSDSQLSLFPFGSTDSLELPARPELAPSSTLSAALDPFTEYMLQRQFTQNTMRSFLHDLGLFIDF